MAITPEVLYQCLKDDVSEQHGPDFVARAIQFGPMWPGITLEEAAASSILHSFLKKLETGRTEATDEAALVKFLKVNADCEKWELPSNIDTATEQLLGEFKRAIYEFWNRDGFALWDNPFAILEKSKIGPGANLDAKGGDFYTKFFSSKLSCSDHSLYLWYYRYIQRFPIWASAEENRIAHLGQSSVRSSSRLAFVPKNDQISRCICIEPTLNTYFQLGIAEIMNRRLSERFGISLDKQQFRNRNLARIGSITDGLSTIDLSSASDSISLRMLQWALPREFYTQLVKYRCSSVEIPKRGTVTLNMISTMGNGYTFPLQTMLFACMVVASLRCKGIPCNGVASDELWGVNGDDIICPRLVTRDVLKLLTLLGFQVNDDKTFVEGPFRESCGSDFFRGTDIRGVYVKSLKTPGSRYAVFNQLVRFSTKTGVRLPKTLAKLLLTVKFLPVPRDSNSDSGIQLPLSLSRKHIRRDKHIFGWSYRSIEECPVYARIEDGKIVVPRFAKRRLYNPDGLYISFLQRSVHSGKIGIRSVTKRFRTKQRVTSVWDRDPSLFPGHPDWGIDWQRWESVVSEACESRSEIL